MSDSVKEWYSDEYGEREAQGIPEELTWNALFRAFSLGEAQDPVLEPQAQERCIRKLAEMCRVSIDTFTRR